MLLQNHIKEQLPTLGSFECLNALVRSEGSFIYPRLPCPHSFAIGTLYLDGIVGSEGAYNSSPVCSPMLNPALICDLPTNDLKIHLIILHTFSYSLTRFVTVCQAMCVTLVMFVMFVMLRTHMLRSITSLTVPKKLEGKGRNVTSPPYPLLINQ